MTTLSSWTSNVSSLNAIQLAPKISEEVFNNPIQLQEPEEIDVEAVQYKPPASMKEVHISNSVMVIALSNARIMRLNLNNPDEIFEIVVWKDLTVKIHKVFLDPTGQHCIINLSNQETFYLNTEWTKPKPLMGKEKFFIECIAWDEKACASSGNLENHRILIGTKNGYVYEGTIDSDSYNSPTHFHKEFKFQLAWRYGEGLPVTNMQWSRFKGARDKFFLVVTTSNRFYQYIGGPSFVDVFQAYGEKTTHFETSTPSDRSELKFYATAKPGKVIDTPEYFAWIIGSRLHHGFINVGKQKQFEECVYKKKVFQLDEICNSVLITEYHFILLNKDRLVAFSRNTSEIVWEHAIKGYPLLAFAVDSKTGSIFLYSSKRIYELNIKNETSYLWKKLLTAKDFSTALTFATKQYQKDKINLEQAEYHWEKEEYEKSAALYAKIGKAFEECVLKFTESNNKQALCVYLSEKLKNLRYQDACQKTLLVTWLIELYIQQLDTLDYYISTKGNGTMRPPTVKSAPERPSTSTPMQGFSSGNEAQRLQASQSAGNLNSAVDEERKVQGFHAEKENVMGKIRELLTNYTQDLTRDSKTTYNLLTTYSQTSLVAQFAQIVGDYEFLISFYLEQRHWEQAISVLPHIEPASIVKNVSFLMYNAPDATVNMLMKIHTKIKPKELLPALMRCDENKVNAGPIHPVARFLEFVIAKGCIDKEIHNYLLIFYAKLDSENKIVDFIRNAEDTKRIYFELDFAIQLCHKYHKKQAEVILYSIMELYEDAVSLALGIDIELAKRVANKPRDPETKKNLWLTIVKHLVEGKNNVKGAMAALQQCPLLTIEDVIRFLPDNSDEICECIEESNRRVLQLKEEMNKATQSSELIQKEIEATKKKPRVLDPNKVCDISGLPILNKQFYLFADGSCYLLQPLYNKIQGLLTPEEKIQAQSLITQILNLGSSHKDEIEVLRKQLDPIIGRENPVTSKLFLESVKKPFNLEDNGAWAL